jgi:peptidoglycan/LPS O-acetylase OafA/YrhL
MARLTDRPPPPPESPFLRPAPRPQLPPADPAVRQRAWAALALAALSLLTMMLMSNIQRGIYVVSVALAVAAVAVALAVSAMSAARRAGARRPRGAVAGTVLGVIGFVLSAFALAAFLIFHTQLDQYATCMNGAITNSQQQACQTQLNNSIGTEVDLLGGS